MNITIKNGMPNIEQSKRLVQIEVPDGVTIKSTLEEYFRKYDLKIDISYMPGIAILLNNKPTTLTNIPGNGDTIELVKVSPGG
ncbi:MAG: hypothetical protein LBC73_09530 [Oscillospiraceae bacterium]|jgi:hypothetical protein|nr:hypothetical protein [Oscillospiraceae bacterium]